MLNILKIWFPSKFLSIFSSPLQSTLPVLSQDPFQHNSMTQYKAIRQLIHALYQLQLENPTAAGAAPVSLLVPASPAPPIRLSGHAPQIGTPTMSLSHSVPPIVSSSILQYVPLELFLQLPLTWRSSGTDDLWYIICGFNFSLLKSMHNSYHRANSII